MSGRQVIWAWGCLFAVLGGLGFGLSVGQETPKKPAPKIVAADTLIPENTVLFVHFDGNGAHQEGWEKTAAYEALYGSGLMPTIEKVMAAMSERNSANASEEQKQAIAAIQSATENLSQKGFLISVSLPKDGPPLPQVVFVARDAAALEPVLGGMISKIADQNGMKFETKEIEGRAVKVGIIPDSPGVEVSWWTEGTHLVAAAGINATETMIGVATGKSPSIVGNASYKKYNLAKPTFDITATSWLDLGLLRTTFGEMPLPNSPNPEKPVTINAILAAIGMDKVGTVVSQQGYSGKSIWSESFIEAPAPRTGLLALCDQKPIKMKDLPPIPWGMTGFGAGSCDFSKLYSTLLDTAMNVAKLGPEDAAAQVEGTINQIPAIVGFDPKADLLDTLGNVYCLYGDSRGGLFGLDFAAVVQVKEPEKLKTTIDEILGMVAEQVHPRDLTIRRTKKHGREIITLEMAQGFVSPSLAVDEKWLCIGLFPQTVESFLLRLDGKLTPWEPTESYATALDAVPKEFTSISVSDPRRVYRALMGFAPLLMPAIQQAARSAGIGGADGFTLPVNIADLPPGELVARPLFPNIALSTVDDTGIRWTSRSSLPSFPFLGATDSGAAVGTTAVAVALLLPAVQQAREAARRAQSANNMKQIALALHNYYDTHDGFPQGTHVGKNKELKVEERFSWQASILPYLDQPALQQALDMDEKWNVENNEILVSTVIPTLHNPGVSEGKKPAKYATTHYVGIAGVGKDAPTLDVKSKKAGVFGYNRQTKFRDITDGTSNTAMISEASKDYGPWAQGGASTIRSLTTKPYINGPDGIGGPYKGGCYIGLADGSVRFVSENVDPSVMEALSTIAGGEVVGDF